MHGNQFSVYTRNKPMNVKQSKFNPYKYNIHNNSREQLMEKLIADNFLSSNLEKINKKTISSLIPNNNNSIHREFRIIQKRRKPKKCQVKSQNASSIGIDDFSIEEYNRTIIKNLSQNTFYRSSSNNKGNLQKVMNIPSPLTLYTNNFKSDYSRKQLKNNNDTFYRRIVNSFSRKNLFPVYKEDDSKRIRGLGKKQHDQIQNARYDGENRKLFNRISLIKRSRSPYSKEDSLKEFNRSLMYKKKLQNVFSLSEFTKRERSIKKILKPINIST